MFTYKESVGFLLESITEASTDIQDLLNDDSTLYSDERTIVVIQDMINQLSKCIDYASTILTKINDDNIKEMIEDKRR